MKFKLGPLPENDDFNPSELGWRRLTEPGPILLQALAIPTAVVMLVLAFFFYTIFIGEDEFRIDMTLVWWAIVILTPIHEFVHAISTPSWGMSDKTVVGFWPRKILPYTLYTDAWNRSRVIWFLIMPFVILSVLPATGMCFWKLDSPVLYHFILINAGLSSGDILQVPIFLFQVPRHAVIKNKGWNSYWRV
jgi:hypothetical protein